MRRKLKIGPIPDFDPDVKAGRLMNADAWLADFIYNQRGFLKAGGDSPDRGGRTTISTPSNVIGPKCSAWDIARDAYNSPETVYLFPDGTKKRGNEISKWNQIPVGTKVYVGEVIDGNTRDSLRKVGRGGEKASEIAGESAAENTTFYFFPDGRVCAGSDLSQKELALLPEGTSVLVGYVLGGVVSTRNSAFQVCGSKWNMPSTLYYLPDGTFKWGDEINEKKIPAGSRVFYCK